MKKILSFNMTWVIVLALVMGMGFASCSSDDDDNNTPLTGELNEYEQVLVGTWESVGYEGGSKVMYFVLNPNRTGVWSMYYNGSFVASMNLTNWGASSNTFTVTYEGGKKESVKYSVSGKSAVIDDVQFQKK